MLFILSYISHMYSCIHIHIFLLSLLLLEEELGASNDAKGLVPASNSMGGLLECNPTS